MRGRVPLQIGYPSGGEALVDQKVENRFAAAKAIVEAVKAVEAVRAGSPVEVSVEAVKTVVEALGPALEALKLKPAKSVEAVKSVVEAVKPAMKASNSVEAVKSAVEALRAVELIESRNRL